MIIINSNEFKKNGKLNISPCCVALGNFDGMHIGHMDLINSAKKYAEQHQLPLLVYTFAVHPKIYFNSNFKLITTPSEKNDLFDILGIDYLYLEDFIAVKGLSPTEFCEEILVKRLNAKAVFCGANHRFGLNASGSAEFMANHLEKHKAKIFIKNCLMHDGQPVSSSRIRSLIERGDIPSANVLLGKSFFIKFPVVHGCHLGSKLGFPTINQIIPHDKIVPPYGVYACYTHINGKMYPSVLNIGTKPTVTYNEKNPPVVCETHIIDFNNDLYNKTIQVDFICKIRDEQRFENINILKEAVLKDIESAKSILEI